VTVAPSTGSVNTDLIGKTGPKNRSGSRKRWPPSFPAPPSAGENGHFSLREEPHALIDICTADILNPHATGVLLQDAL
jgi:hypothetical protein